MAKKKSQQEEPDGTFLLKVVLYILAGSLWLKFDPALSIGGVFISGVPIGLLIGLLFARHEHFQLDRKLGYVILIIMTIVSFFLPTGIVV